MVASKFFGEAQQRGQQAQEPETVKCFAWLERKSPEGHKPAPKTGMGQSAK